MAPYMRRAPRDLQQSSDPNPLTRKAERTRVRRLSQSHREREWHHSYLITKTFRWLIEVLPPDSPGVKP